MEMPKNGPNLFWTGESMKKMANPIGTATEIEKAVIYERSLPQNLRQEMKAYMGEGRSFKDWLNRLTVRFGNATELERKQWREMQLKYKGKVEVADWRSFMAMFMEGQRRVRATNEEALTVLMNAVPGWIQGWITKFKVRRSYREKKCASM